jgi:hypothetical protein
VQVRARLRSGQQYRGQGERDGGGATAATYYHA